jgi:uncharacterized repeat protein (TIGR01451 family)
LLLSAVPFAHADVYVLDSDSVAAAAAANKGAATAKTHRISAGSAVRNVNFGRSIKPGEKQHRGVALNAVITATGSAQLIDASGLKYFINTNITFSTSSSASGAMSEASYTHAVAATTSAGGTTMSTLNDAFDGYDSICVSLTGATGPCQTGNAAYTIYNKNGPAALDATVPAVPECTNRQYVFAAQTIGGLSVSRKIYVPTNDSFSRSLNYFTNTTGAPITFNMITSNNLGSDSNTRVVTTSSGDNVVTTADTWVTSFQNYSGNTSSDPREGHVMWGPGASVPISFVNFVDGDDNPYWDYSITLAPGQTGIIMNFVTALPTKAAAAAQAAALDALPATSLQCMSAAEKSQLLNFQGLTPPKVSGTKTVAGGTSVGSSGTYTVVLSNSGQTAQGDNPGNEFVDVLPANLNLVSATASSGTAVATVATRTVTWNGSIAPAGSVTITINFTIASGVPGMVVSNQGTINYDADGNGTNESTAQTDDPAVAGAANPTTFAINAPPAPGTNPAEPAPGPGPLGLSLLAALLAGLGYLALRARAR